MFQFIPDIEFRWKILTRKMCCLKMNKLCIFDLSMKFIFFEMSLNTRINLRFRYDPAKLLKIKIKLCESSLFIKLSDFLIIWGEMTGIYSDASKFHLSLLLLLFWKWLKILSLSFTYLHIFHNLKQVGLILSAEIKWQNRAPGSKPFILSFLWFKKINYARKKRRKTAR